MRLVRFGEAHTGIFLELPSGPHVLDVVASDLRRFFVDRRPKIWIPRQETERCGDVVCLASTSEA
jgi:hypothetical protein